MERENLFSILCAFINESCVYDINKEMDREKSEEKTISERLGAEKMWKRRIRIQLN